MSDAQKELTHKLSPSGHRDFVIEQDGLKGHFVFFAGKALGIFLQELLRAGRIFPHSVRAEYDPNLECLRNLWEQEKNNPPSTNNNQ